MITLDGVGRRFADGTQALSGISLRIAAGDAVALLGPSGCGKSTLLRLLAGLDRPDTGRLSWDGGPPPAPGRIGMVFQDPTLLPWAGAAENVALPLRLRGVPRAERGRRALEALEGVGLAGFAATRPRALSGGMRMRVSIARALAGRPALLLMDEPFAALDEWTRHELQDLLLRLCTPDTALVFVTHSSAEAAYLARRVLVLSPRPGRVAAALEAALPPPPGRRDSSEYGAWAARIAAAARAAQDPAGGP